MNHNKFIVYDFETTSTNPHRAQPVQLAAVAVCPYKLKIIQGSEFETLMRPIFDLEECEQLGLDPLTEDSIAKHRKTEEILRKAPPTKEAWLNFADYTLQYNKKQNDWTAPISVGYNNRDYDIHIARRLCSQAPYNFGPKSEKWPQGTIFHPLKQVDVVDYMFAFFENDKAVNSLSADNLIRKHMGYKDPKGHAHDALSDVIMTAEVFIRSLKMIRGACRNRNFEGCFQAKGA